MRVCPVSCCANCLLTPVRCAWEKAAQIISCIAAVIFTSWARAYEKKPGLTVVITIVSTVFLAAIFVPEKLEPIEEGARFLRKNFDTKLLENPDQDSINFVLGTIFYKYCFGKYKNAEPPIFLSEPTRKKITEWRSRRLCPVGYKTHLDKLKEDFGKDNYDDSGNALFNEVKAVYFNEYQARTTFMKAWAKSIS